jgi:hypothetical protein
MSSIFIKSVSKWFSGGVIGLLLACVTQASPITYTISGVTDGTLQVPVFGSTSPVLFFNPSAFKITAVADTANVTPHPLLPSSIVAFAVANQKVTIEVSGLGLFNLIDPGYTQLFRSNQVIVIGQLTQSPYIVGQTFAAITYDLSGPLAETALNIPDKSIFYTDRGVLVLKDKFFVSDGKISAAIGAVPVPATIGLLMLPLLMIGAAAHRKSSFA